MRVYAVADSDSYLKWVVATVATLPPEAEVSVVVVDNPVRPSEAQRAAVTSWLAANPPTGSGGWSTGDGPRPTVLSVARLAALLARDRPDVVLLGCTGPVVAALARLPVLRGRNRPVLVSGLPGVSIPASARALELRAAVDLFVVHSRRERAEFADLAADVAPCLTVGLARLPFLATAGPAPAPPGRDVVFAAQAKVPPRPEDRTRVLAALAAVEPPGSAVIKLRAAPGEQQTHRERWPYPVLWTAAVAEGLVRPDAVRFEVGSMAAALSCAEGLVTVSSTAALEAMAAGVGVLVLADFGVSAAMINAVFEGSGCLGTLDDLRARRFFRPTPGWLAENYFHPEEESDWLRLLSGLLATRHATGLPAPARGPVGAPAARLRQAARLWLPRPVRQALGRTLRRTRRARRRLAPGLPRRPPPPGPGGPGRRAHARPPVHPLG